MRKIYFSAVLITLGTGSALAQVPTVSSIKAPRVADPGAYSVRPHQQPAPINEFRADPFWTEDFSGSDTLPAGWTNVDDMTPAGQVPVLFEWSNDPDEVVIAALGHDHIATFNSATASNGYIYANSDRGLTAAPTVNHLTRLTTTAIDCSTQPTVLVTFQSVIGVYNNNANEYVKLRVSTDLTNWTDFYPFPCLVTTGTPLPPCVRFSANPQLVEIDITSAAAMQETVYLQWEWQGGWEYYWAIDDIALYPVPEYSRVLISTLQAHSATEVEYARVPLDQLNEDFILGAKVRNNGLNAQTNITVTATIEGPGGSPTVTGTETLAVVDPGDTVTMQQTVTLPTGMTTGAYTVTYNVVTDQDDVESTLDDDQATRHFEVTNDVYSLDGIGVYPAGVQAISSMGTSSFIDEQTQDGLQLMNLYSFNQTTTFYGVEALLDDGSVSGGSYEVSIYSADDILVEPPAFGTVDNPLFVTDIYTITEADITAGKIVATFPGGLELEAGDYFAAVTLYSSSGASHVRILDDITVAQPSGASVVWFPIEGEEDNLGGNGNAFAIRLLLNEAVSINEEELLNVSVYPNPTKGLVNILMGETGNYDVEVLNLLGERIHSTNFSNNTVLDLSGNAAGVYMVRISNDHASSIQRITLN